MEQSTVKVRGTARVSGPPDHAKITIEFTAKSSEANSAFEEVAQRSRQLEQLMAELGIPEEAIRSKNVQLRDSARYDRNDPAQVVAENELEVTLPDQDAVGRLITIAVRDTEAHVSGLQWELAPDSDLHRQALRKAAEDARAKAELHARAMGVQLGSVLEISDYAPSYSPYHDRLGRFSLEDSAEQRPAFKVFEGRVEVDASIEVTFMLLNGEG